MRKTIVAGRAQKAPGTPSGGWCGSKKGFQKWPKENVRLHLRPLEDAFDSTA